MIQTEMSAERVPGDIKSILRARGLNPAVNMDNITVMAQFNAINFSLLRTDHQGWLRKQAADGVGWLALDPLYELIGGGHLEPLREHPGRPPLQST